MATERQKLAVDKIIENRGNVSRAMLEVGYSPATARNPKNLTDSDGFKELMETYLPDDMLLRALSDDIEKKEGNRKAELELAFKIKGRMTEKHDHTSNGQSIVFALSEVIANKNNVIESSPERDCQQP
jgi:hypothetical protein